MGIELQIEGEEKLLGWGGKTSKGPCVFIINHQSEIDIFVLARVHFNYLLTDAEMLTGPQLWQTRTVSCAVWRVGKMPVFGIYMKLSRSVFVDPPKSSSLTNEKIIFGAAARLQREGLNLVMFPVRLSPLR